MDVDDETEDFQIGEIFKNKPLKNQRFLSERKISKILKLSLLIWNIKGNCLGHHK